MTNRKNGKIKYFTTAMLTMVGLGLSCGQFTTSTTVAEIKYPIVNTANTVESTSTPEAVDTASREFPDEDVLDSKYFSYGQGCLFVTVQKDAVEPEGDGAGATDTESEVGGEDETGMETESPSPTEDVTSGGAVASSMENSGLLSSKNLFEACLTPEEQQELFDGENKEIKIVLRSMDMSEVDGDTVTAIDDAVEEFSTKKKGFSLGDYISINVKKKTKEGKWKKVKDFNTELKFLLDIPKEMQTDTAKYSLISVNKGETKLLEDTDKYNGVISVAIDHSGVYAFSSVMSVKDDKATVTSAPDENKSGLALFWDRMNNEAFCLWHWFFVPIMILGITWILAINSKTIRTVFFGIECVIGLLLAIAGHCEYDWPFFIGMVVILGAIYGWRLYSQRNE